MKFAAFSVAAALAVGVNGVSDYVKKNVRKNMGDDRVVHISHDQLDSEMMAKIVGELEADHFSVRETGHHFKLSPEAVRALEEQSISFEDTTEEWIAQFEENFNNKDFACTEGAKCAERDMQVFYSQFQPLEALHARMENLANSVSFASIGSIGTTYEGRDQKTVNIGDQSKPLVFYFCNIHAREWLPPMFCMYMIETLIADGGHPLLDTFSFTVLTSANPDGYVYTWTNDNLWRKTRKPNPGSSCVGTDPNRNYDNRHCGVGTSNSPCSQIYCGTEPWSEIEVANIRDFALANQNRLIAMNDVHSKGQLWMHPYGGVSADPPNPDYSKMFECSGAAADAIRAESGTNWAYGPVYSTIYPAAGVSVDWFYDTVGVIYAMTAELRGDSWQPPPSFIMPSNREVFAAMVGSLNCVAEKEGLGGSAPVPDPTPAPDPTPTPDPTPAPVAAPTCFFFFC